MLLISVEKYHQLRQISSSTETIYEFYVCKKKLITVLF
uniref:Uncharacterized protein n=1 Tax=Arundo donax TaxID=35708 RepID=A0A0A9CPJ7_ARUDO